MFIAGRESTRVLRRRTMFIAGTRIKARPEGGRKSACFDLGLCGERPLVTQPAYFVIPICQRMNEKTNATSRNAS